MSEKPTSLWKRPLWPDVWLLRPVDWLLRLPWLLIRGLFSWRMLKRYFFCLACLATLIALAYAEENWRGRHDWNKFKNEWVAKGETFDWHDFIPPPVPDDQNFAMTPFWEDVRYQWDLRKSGAQMSQMLTNTNLTDRLDRLRFSAYRFGPGAPQPPPSQGSWMDASNVDLKGWQAYYREPQKKIAGDASIHQPALPIPPQPGDSATDVLFALAGQNDLLQMFRAASQRPYSRFPINYEDAAGSLLPHLAKLKGTAQYLNLLVMAELGAGKTAQAVDDVNLMFYLNDSIKSEPYVISHLVRAAIFNINLNGIWQGMADRQWSEAQLKSFQDQLESDNMLADLQRAMKSECAFLPVTVDKFAASRLAYLADLYEGSQLPRKLVLYVRYAPRGWFEQGMILFARQQLEAAAVIDPKAQRVDFKQLAALQPDFDAFEQRTSLLSGFGSGYEDQSSAHVATVVSIIRKAVRTQTALNLGITACALERYWLENKSYPEKLDQLVPKFLGKLPHEIGSGEPFKYRRSEDGRFVLYSTGLDGNDSGGFYRTGKDHHLTGNWVWRYSAPQASLPPGR